MKEDRAPIRVLHLIATLRTGGAETFVITMMKALEGRCQSQVFTLFTGEVYDGGSADSYCDDGAEPAPVRNLMRLARHLRKWRPDVIHMHMGDATLLGSVAAALSGSPAKRIAHWHSARSLPPGVPLPQPRSALGRLLSRWALASADAVIGCARAALAVNSERYPYAPGSRYCVYNSVDVAAFAAAETDDDVRARLGLRDDEVVLVFVGRMTGSGVQTKGIDVLYEAVRRLSRELRVRVILVGPVDEAVSDSPMPSDAVTVMGPVNHIEMPTLLSACDVYLQPSRWEGLPLSVVEAMAAGLPVIASRVGGVPEAVVDGETGILVPPEDPQSLADAIQWMVEHPVQRVEMGRRGQERAQLFDVHTIARQLEAIYYQVLDGTQVP